MKDPRTHGIVMLRDMRYTRAILSLTKVGVITLDMRPSEVFETVMKRKRDGYSFLPLPTSAKPAI